jgi:hypothetical protein
MEVPIKCVISHEYGCIGIFELQDAIYEGLDPRLPYPWVAIIRGKVASTLKLSLHIAS